MKLVISATILLVMGGTAVAELGLRNKRRLADSTADACFVEL